MKGYKIQLGRFYIRGSSVFYIYIYIYLSSLSLSLSASLVKAENLDWRLNFSASTSFAETKLHLCSNISILTSCNLGG